MGAIRALEDVATRLRIGSVRATTAAGSGHPSSAASAADLVAALMFGAMRLDPEHPRSPDGDRLVLSKGHAAPVLYAAWAEAGRLEREALLELRRLDSDLEGHPTPRLPFVDVATGSLGQGLSIGLGLALGARCHATEARTFVLLGDGECAEGSVWEAAALAAHYRVDTLIAVVDVNGLGQSGPTMLRHDLRAWRRRFEAFGWRALAVDGHDMAALVDVLRRARRRRGAPTAVVARTVKGRGLEGIEDREEWHGRALPEDMARAAVAALERRLHHLPPPRIRPPRRRPGPARIPAGSAPGAEAGGGEAGGGAAPGAAAPAAPGAESEDRPGPRPAQVATREAYGTALAALVRRDPRVVVLDGDVKNSTHADRALRARPDRFIEAYIAEQNMVGMAAGLAAQGWVPFASSFACFLTRAADQLRMAAISRSNIKLCGSHAGVSIGEDGPSQMGLEDLALFRALPECAVLYPADGAATEACVQLAAAHPGLVYLRTTRPRTPRLYGDDEPFAIGGLKVVRAGDRDRLAIVAAGITLFEALAAYDELMGAGLAVRVIDLYSVKPVDSEGLRRAAAEAGRLVLTVEDHYPQGGLGDAVLEAVGPAGIAVHRLAVPEIPRSGPPARLLERYGIGRGAIAARVRSLLGQRREVAA